MLSWKQVGPKKCFLDPHIKKEAKKLDPCKYATHSNWGDSLKSNIEQGHSRKGMFLPRERPLMTAEVISDAKKRNVPAPGAYEASKGNKPILGFSTISKKTTYHVDEAIHYAKLTPAICYGKDFSSSLTSLVKPRILHAKIPEVKETAQEDNRIKLKKSINPDMGSYNADKAKDYLVNKTGYSGKLSPAPFVRFYEPNLKRRKGVPAPSHY